MLLLLLIFVVAVIVLAAAAAAIVRAQRRARITELQERYGLTDDEIERFQDELPDVAQGIASSLPPGSRSRKEIAEMAEESALRGVLLKRVPRPPDED